MQFLQPIFSPLRKLKADIARQHFSHGLCTRSCFGDSRPLDIRFEQNKHLVLFDQFPALDLKGLNDSVDAATEINDHVRFDDTVQLASILSVRTRGNYQCTKQ
jgi:hypothetical protein